MGATKIEFRLRVVIMAAFVILGFWAPWIERWGVGSRNSLWQWLAIEASRLGVISVATAGPLFIGTGALFAVAGVLLRVWGVAYLGISTVGNKQMLADAVRIDGPYRLVRNPLYLGSWCIFAAMSFLMPVTGALVALPLLTLHLLRLIFGEEAFLDGQLGQPYRDYLQSVPRLIPRLHSLLAPSDVKARNCKPRWMSALLSQSVAIGTFLTLAVYRWSNDNWLLAKAIILCFCASVVIQSVVRRTSKHAQPAK
jgi:protein-S-isoprenylcysteine O-methyltransferase Ste14